MTGKPDPGRVPSLEEAMLAVKQFAKEQNARERAKLEAQARLEETAAALESAQEPPRPESPPRSEAVEPAAPAVEPERLAEAVRRAEAVLFASAEPLSAAQLAQALPPGVEPGDVLVVLQEHYRTRGVQLVEIAGKWRFQTAQDLAFLFEETREQPRQLSRAALETLAIIAYCQPVTRAEIEDVRGVAVSKGTLDVLMEVGWVKVRGRRQTPGRPVTYGVTEDFQIHFGLESIDALPGKEDLRAQGLLSSAIPADFQMAGTPRDPETGEPLVELPLEPPEFQSDFMEGGDDRA